jgi:hypothetical protein
MKKHLKGEDGMYTINGKKFKELIGSRVKVWNGTAYKTPGELPKTGLMMNKWNRIVSRKKNITAKREMRLQKHGFFAKKGHFGYVQGTPSGTRRSRRTRRRR